MALTDNLVAYYRLSDSSDSSGNGKTLTEIGTPTYVSGKIENCLDLGTSNSTKTVKINDNFGINGASARTISLWANYYSFATASQTAAALYDGTTKRGTYIYSGGSGNAYIVFAQGGYGVNENSFSGNTPLTIGTWYNIVLTYDGSTVYGYINGVPQGSVVSTGSNGNTILSSFSVGSNYGYGVASAYFASAKFDEVGVWSRVLTTSEISELYNNGLGNAYPFPIKSMAKSLVGYWPLDGNSLDYAPLAKSVFDTPLYSDANIRAYYRLEGNSTASVGGVNGTDTSVTYGSSKFGQGATFNGTSSKVVLADNTVFKPTSTMTINCWFKNSSATQAGFAQSWSQNTNLAGWRLWRNGTTELRLDIGSNTGTVENTHWAMAAANIPTTDNKWRMLTGTYDGSTIRLYVNGIEVDNTSYTGSIGYAGTNYVRIGCLNNAGTDLFGSTTFDEDDVSIFGRALSSAEIADLYSKGISGISQANNGIVTSTAYNADENFETYSTGTSISGLSSGYGWTTNWTKSGTGTATIETKPSGGSPTGTKALKITGTTAVGAYRQFGNRTQGYLSFWARINTVTPDNQVVVLIGEGGTNKTGFQFDSTGYIKYYNGSSYTNIQTYSADTWYQIEMEWDDVSQADKMRYRINGGAWSSWVTIGAYTYLSQIYINFDAQTPSADFWIDDIVVNGGGGVFTPSYNQHIPISLGCKFASSTDRVKIGNPTAIQIAGAQTHMFWCKCAAALSTNKSLYSKGGIAGAADVNIVVHLTTDNQTVFYVNGNTLASIILTASETNMAFYSGKWTHIALRYIPSSSISIFVNGVKLRESTTTVPSYMDTDQSLGFGAAEVDGQTATRQDSFVGYMQEVAIFSRALSSKEISDYYNFITKTRKQMTVVSAEQTNADTTKLLWF